MNRFAYIFGGLFVFIGAALFGANASATPLEVERLDAVAGWIQNAEPPILAHPMALSLDELDEYVDASLFEQRLEALLESDLEPRVAAVVRWQHAESVLRKGEATRADEMIASQGFLSSWHVVGPFPNEGMAGFDQTLPPELGFNINRAVDGTFERLKWRELQTKGRSGYVRLSSVVAPTHNAVIYLTTVIESPRAQDAVLWLSVDGGFKAWMGQDLVAEVRDDLGGPIDREGFRVQLAKGNNLLVIKVANESGYAGLYARLTDTNLDPLPLLHGNQEPTLDGSLAQQPGKQGIRPVPSAIDLLTEYQERLSESDPNWATATGWLGYGVHRMNPGNIGRPGESVLLDALAIAPADPLLVQLSQSVLEESWRRRELVEHALEQHPDDPWLALIRVQQLLAGSVFDRADEASELLAGLETTHPDSVLVRALATQRLDADGLDDAAFEASWAHAREHWDTPAAVDDAHWRAGRLQRYEHQREALQQLVLLRGDVDGYRDDLADLLHQTGDKDAALSVLDDGLAIRPDATQLVYRKIDILDATGDTEGARALWNDIVAMTPTNAGLRESYGNWLLAHEERSAALDAFRSSLELEAQNETLRQMVRYLDPAEASFENPWVVEEVKPWSGVTTADYAVLVDQKIVQVHPNGLSSSYFQTVYQVLTDQGVNQLKIVPLYYTPGEEVFEIEMAEITKPDGSTRQVYNRAEYPVADESVRMYYDYRQVILEFADLDIQDQLEIRYRRSQVSQSNYFDNHFGDVWYANDHVPKRYARYVVSVPADRELQFRIPESGAISSNIERDDERIAYVFEATDVPKIENERMMPGFAEVADYVMVSTFGSWGDVAQWYWNLAKEQWIVDKEIRDVVVELTDGVADRREVVSLIHNYVVKNTRYVALEFGVHGYKPYRTTVCFRRRFGDCKDKASLIKVMLEEAGIAADIVLVRTRRNGEIATDPASLSIFDHAIAYVPEFDLFLDGTAEYSGTNELPAMDQGVTVLVVKDQGEYELKQTPVMPATDNFIENEYAIALGNETALLNGKGAIAGQFAPGYRSDYESTERRENAFEDELSREFPGASVASLEFENVESLEKPVAFQFEAVIPDPLKPSGDKLLLYPHGSPVDLAARLASSTERTQDLVIPFGFEFRNTFAYELSAGLGVVELPPDEFIRNQFGRFEVTFTQSDNRVVVTSTFLLEQRQIAVSDYQEFQEFVLASDRALNTPISLEKR